MQAQQLSVNLFQKPLLIKLQRRHISCVFLSSKQKSFQSYCCHSFPHSQKMNCFWKPRPTAQLLDSKGKQGASVGCYRCTLLLATGKKCLVSGVYEEWSAFGTFMERLLIGAILAISAKELHKNMNFITKLNKIMSQFWGNEEEEEETILKTPAPLYKA